MKGDGELSRIAWSITSDKADAKAIDEQLAFVLASKVEAAIVATEEPKSTEEQIPENKLLALFSELPNNKMVLKLVEKLEKPLSLEDSMFASCK